jgi:AraC-like DNA-binding protein
MKPMFQELPFPIDSHIHYYIEDLPHFIVPWHYHPAIEIMYIIRGTGTRFVGDHLEGYVEGDVCMIGPQLPHEWRNDQIYFNEKLNLRATCICLFFKKEIFEPNLIRLPEMANIRSLIERSRRGIKFVGESKKKIANFIELSARNTGAQKVTELITLLEMMATSEEYEVLAGVGFTESVNSDDFERFNKVYKYLVANFTTPIKLGDVAALVGLTPTAFCRYFKERTKKTFVEYLNDMRIGHAKKLLIEGKKKISTISMESGFNNLSNFICRFKKSTNMLPSDFQKEIRRQEKAGIMIK